MVSNWWWHNGNNFLFQQKWGPIKHSCEKMGPLSTKSPALTYTNWLNNQPARAPFSYNAILSYVTQWSLLFDIVRKLLGLFAYYKNGLNCIKLIFWRMLVLSFSTWKTLTIISTVLFKHFLSLNSLSTFKLPYLSYHNPQFVVFQPTFWGYTVFSNVCFIKIRTTHKM